MRAVLIDAKNPTEEAAQIDVGGHRVSDRRAGEEERRGETVQRWPMPPKGWRKPDTCLKVEFDVEEQGFTQGGRRRIAVAVEAGEWGCDESADLRLTSCSKRCLFGPCCARRCLQRTSGRLVLQVNRSCLGYSA